MAQKGVTLAVVLDHVKGLGYGVHTLERRFNSLEKRMGGMEARMDRLEKKMDEGFARVWRRFDWVGVSLCHIDDRLDSMEIQRLSHRVNKIEKKVFAGADS
ncbi:hypothetical protein FJZ28_05420 [Candidatus Peregrinibacteria bacterium]|nr:hypothetical protein [Candidatus Peregrinibacteria bacterium]